MTDDEFFERLSRDAASLRHQVDDATLTRIRARIHERIAPRASVAELIASWFRPLAAGLAALALAAVIGLTMNGNGTSIAEEPVEVVMGGDTYRVSD
jgi:hypothetical protein